MLVYKFLCHIYFLSIMLGGITIAQDHQPADSKTFSLSDSIIAQENYNKGKLFTEQGKYDSSDIFFNHAIDVYKSLAIQTVNKDYWASVISSYNAIGWNLMMLGKYDSSLVVLENTLELGKSELSEIHPEVAQSYNNIGTVFWYEGKYNKALEMYQNSLKIKSQAYGESSGEVAVTLNNLGLTYHKKGEYD